MKNSMRLTLRFSLLAILGITFSQSLKAELPTQTERTFSLSKIWQEINYTFADSERYNAVNVDSLYQAYLPLVAAEEDEYTYYQLLSSFLANFRDGHTRIMPPTDSPYDFPKLDIELLDNIIYISDTAESLSTEVPRFSQILKVNGIDAYTFLTETVTPNISASTDRWRKDKAAIELLYGKPGTDVALSILTTEGEERDLTLKRDSKNDSSPMLNPRQTMEFDWLSDSILLMALNNCTDVQGARQTFLSHLNDVSSAKGIIIDVRKNRGGSEEAWYLPAFLTLNKDQIDYNGCFLMRTTTPIQEADGNKETDFSNGTYAYKYRPDPYTNGIPAEYRIDTPIVILSGKYTGSAAEFFVQFMRDNHPNLKVIGEPSVGSFSIPSFDSLPGGYTLMIAKGVYCDADDNIISHTGIIPDEIIYLTYENVVKGQDPVLERALELLNSI